MTKARRETIALNTVVIELFQLPDASYRASQSGAAEAIGKPEYSFRDFLGSQWLKSLPGIDSDSGKIEKIQREGEAGAAINAVPLVVVAAFWLKEALKGNKQAQVLTWACLTETLTRRADAAFGVVRSEAEYEAATAEMMKLLGRVARERNLLLESYEIDDDARAIVSDMQAMLDERDRENARLREKIRELGGELYER
jgi:hypothetical protein